MGTPVTRDDVSFRIFCLANERKRYYDCRKMPTLQLGLLFLGLLPAEGHFISSSSIRAFETWRLQFVPDLKFSSEEERARRISIFSANAAEIASHNASGFSWKEALNEFAHLTHDEFASLYASGYDATGDDGSGNDGIVDLFEVPANFSAPAAIDWSARGAVSRPSFLITSSSAVPNKYRSDSNNPLHKLRSASL